MPAWSSKTRDTCTVRSLFGDTVRCFYSKTREPFNDIHPPPLHAPKTFFRLQGSSSGSTAAAVLGGDGLLSSSSLFSVKDSSTLHLEDIALEGGGGAKGGAVAACGNASVVLIDCAVSGNAVSDSGGEKQKKQDGCGGSYCSGILPIGK